MSARPLSLLFALLALVLLVDLGCTTRRGGGGGGRGDDDTADDDDAADDDDLADDDDAADDDDLTDDDDATGPGRLAFTASPLDFGDVRGGSAAATVTLENTGGEPVAVSLNLTWTGDAGVFELSGSELQTLTAGQRVTRSLSFRPDENRTFFTSIVAEHDGANASPLVLRFTGSSNFATESACGNGVDDDGDTYADCADWDCLGDPACGDPCCGTMPWPGQAGYCDSASALSCLCAGDDYCCLQGWSTICADNYAACGASCPVR